MSARTSQHVPQRAAHSLRIGRLLGIPLQVHWSFILLVALVVGAEWRAGTAAIVAGFLWVAALFACVVAHELAHCVLARRRGVTVLGILLLPIGGLSRMEEIPSSPSDEAAIAAVGPATSLVLGGLFLALGAALGGALWPPTLLAGPWFVRLGWLNVLLAGFNMLPALPMDGGRVLRATLSRRLPRLTATRVAASVARVVALAMMVAGVLFDFWFVLVGMFVLLGASGEEAAVRARESASRPPPTWGWWSSGSAPPGDTPWPPWPPPQSPPPWPPQQAPGWYPPPQEGGPWPPPWGQQPSPRTLPVDVAVERRGPHPGGGEPLGEGVGQHD